ncbi:MAG TPA: hypothetical protein VGD04_03010 [Methylophilus sp.]
MYAIREQEAVTAYLKFLKNKQVTQENLAQRSLFLNTLCQALEDKRLDRNDYARALNIVIRKHPQAVHHYIKLAREFYPFWMHDIKAIAALSQSYDFHETLIEWTPAPTSLKALTSALATELFNDRESAALERYHHHLHGLNEDKAFILTKIKLAKIILLRMRSAPSIDASLYRITVDATLPLFRWKKSKQLFLYVVREFYYFWIVPLPAQQAHVATSDTPQVNTNFPKTSTRSSRPASLYLQA